MNAHHHTPPNGRVRLHLLAALMLALSLLLPSGAALAQTPQPVAPETIGMPFGSCQTWEVYQGYQAGTHSSASSLYAIDLVPVVNGQRVLSTRERFVIVAPVSGWVETYGTNYPGMPHDRGVRIHLRDAQRTSIQMDHLTHVKVGNGQWVQAGTEIGQVNNSAPGTIFHVHVQARRPSRVGAPGPVIPLVFNEQWNLPAGARNIQWPGYHARLRFSTPCVNQARTVAATSSQVDTGITLRMGDRLQASQISGTWAISGRDARVGASGYSYRASWGLSPNEPIGALLVRVGSGPWMRVSEGAVFTGRGTVVLAINDGWHGDNIGAISLRLSSR